MEPRTQAFGIKRIATYGLLLIGCSAYGQGTAVRATAAQAATVSPTCANGDLGNRSKLYNKDGFLEVQEAFKDHFMVQVASVHKELTNTSVSLSVSDLLVLRDQLKAFAIKVHYGLKGTAFYPVFEFMKLSANDAAAEPMGIYYLAVNGVLKKADASLPVPSDLMDEYKKNIRIFRLKGSTVGDTLIPDTAPYADPLAEWFQFPLELDRLIADNPGKDQKLVLNCISEAICYSAAHGLTDAPGPGEEFRHMIAWYIETSGTTQLDSTELDKLRTLHDYYVMRAMDLGHLCPPRCY